MQSFINRFLKHIHNLPEQKKMLVNMSYSAAMVNKHFELILDTYLITPPQYNLLAILRGTYPKPCTVRELKDMIIDRDSDVSRMVLRLQASGLVDSKIRKNDKRALDVIISKKGLDLLKEIDEKESEAMFNPFMQISEAEAKQLNELLQKVLEGLAAHRPL